jgi:hypothetical protein
MLEKKKKVNKYQKKMCKLSENGRRKSVKSEPRPEKKLYVIGTLDEKGICVDRLEEFSFLQL